jgi:methylmalonyl-CoA mutase
MSPPIAAPARYRPKHAVRIVTAASLFDGHDAAINLMRRILQASGAEVIHLGHNRSVKEIVDAAVQEDVQGVAVTSYQGGHVEFFRYTHDLLVERGSRAKIFGGGGGTILPSEIDALHAYGIGRIYSPDDGRSMGLQGMIDDVLRACDFPTVDPAVDARPALERLSEKHWPSIARLITLLESHGNADLRAEVRRRIGARPPILGVTGTGGSGKSSLVDELIRRFLSDFSSATVAVVSVDPSRKRTGGALLGDRIRMNAVHDDRVYVRSLATRQSNVALSQHAGDAIDVLGAAGYDLVIVETSGIGQSDTEITDHADVSLYVMTSEYGAATQLEKIDMLDFADLVAINKFDKAGSEDALRDVRKQVRRNRSQFSGDDRDLPVYPTIACEFADPGVDRLYAAAIRHLEAKGFPGPSRFVPRPDRERMQIIPAARVRYLAEISEACRKYDAWVAEQARIARTSYQMRGVIEAIQASPRPADVADLERRAADLERQLDPAAKALLDAWPEMKERYASDVYRFEVRDKVIEQPLTSTTMSGTPIAKVYLPRYRDHGDILEWLLEENVPGEFPYTAGVFPLKRKGEDPARMFAGEGGPERTNRRFHYVSRGMPARRLSTAFDSVTLYGEDPDPRPDIYGKIGNSGVSVATVDDAKRLYSGFDLVDPATSVSMTINGPAPMVLGFFLNAAIDQGCERHIRATGLTAEVERVIAGKYAGRARPTYRGDLPEGNDGLGLLLLGVSGDEVLPRETYERIRADVLSKVRGTVQADILKEDQAQNTCIFSTEFALRMMGDIQAYFIERDVRNFYSVSISGYHIAEAGANPITQLAFTLANGFTFVEYYLARGMPIDAFAPNLSFFFSNGLDAEYSVIGRVARRIWAKAILEKYEGNERSQKLKYHVQTSGRSLHAQEIAFNDIRTTLQALYALTDNTSSLHTNAYDEAITTPTEESVRRAMAIQLIINQELGLSRNENPLQGSFFIEELTDLVEAAVLEEFDRISDRGGVLGAMERMYQRSKIQDESLRYEEKKHTGELPIVGVNTFLSAEGSPTILPREVIRSTEEEKRDAIAARVAFMERNRDVAKPALERLERGALHGENLFEILMETTKVCTLGQISASLYRVGGQYRRSM